MGCTSLAIIFSVAAVALAAALPYDPTEDFIDRSLFRDQRLFTSDLAAAQSSGFSPTRAGRFYGSNIVATPHLLRSSVAAQVPLLTLAPCPKGLVRNAAGRCVKPVVLKNVFLFKAPFVKAPKVPLPKIPKPKVLYNYVYVNSADSVKGPKPIVVPPPQEKTLVYVLNKRPEPIRQEVIEVPPPQDTEPEVFFINYNEGQNQQLPGGVDLQTVLSQSAGQQAVSLAGSSDLSLFADSSAAAAFGGQVTQLGALGGGSDFDFSDEIFDGGISSLSSIQGVSGLSGLSSVSGLSGLSGLSGVSSVSGVSGLSGLSGYGVPSSARSFSLSGASSSSVQRLIPTIPSGESNFDSDESFLDQDGDHSTVGEVSVSSGILSENDGGNDGGSEGGSDSSDRGDAGDGGSGGDDSDGSSSATDESFEDSDGSQEKRSTKVRKFIAPTNANLKSAGQSKLPSKKAKSVVIALVKPPSLKSKYSVADDLKPSGSETVAVQKTLSGDDTLTIPVLTSEDVKELLDNPEPKEDS